MSTDLSALADRLLTAAKTAGADAADALVVRGQMVSIEVTGGALEMANRSEGVDLGLRVFVGQRQANIAISSQSDQAISEAASRCVTMATLAPEDPHCRQASPDQVARDWDAAPLDLVDPDTRPTPDQLQEAALTAEAAALDVAGVSQVQSGAAGYSDTEIHLATSAGFQGGYALSSHSLSCVAIAGSGLGMERDYAGEGRSHYADLPDPVSQGRLAGERAVARLGAEQPPTGSYPVLFDERISSSLIGHLTSAINGVSIARGSSWLLDALDTPVLPDGMDLIEDPHRPRTSGARPFDGEGLPVSRRAVIENGVLRHWTLDLSTGHQLGLPSTGNASRGVSAPPSPALGNLTLTPGKQSRNDLIRDMGTGFLVTSLIGSTINPNTGDYSRGASGFWVENGAISHPVNEGTIAGNLRDMLRRMIPANDGRAYLSRVIPSLLIEGMTIAGK